VWVPQIVVQPPPDERPSCGGSVHRFLLAVGAVRYSSWQEDSKGVYSRKLERMHPNFTASGKRGRLVRTVSNAVRARLLRVWSLFWLWWLQDGAKRWWHLGSKRRLGYELRALLLSFNRDMRTSIVDGLTGCTKFVNNDAKEELWRLIRSTAFAKKTCQRSSDCEASVRPAPRSGRSNAPRSSKRTSLKPPRSRAFVQRTRYL
jgi:hypothetical protein